MRALGSLVVTLALLGAVAPVHAAPPPSIDRHATIAPASDDAAAPSLPDALFTAPTSPPSPAPLVVFAALTLTPRPAPAAALPLYLRDRSLLL
jgi:hypothetical protein